MIFIVLTSLVLVSVEAQYVRTVLLKPMPAPLQFLTYAIEPHIHRVESINQTLSHMLLLDSATEEEVAPRIPLAGKITSSKKTVKCKFAQECILTTVSTSAVVDGFGLRNKTLTTLRLRVHLPVNVLTMEQGFTVANEAATATITFGNDRAFPTTASANTTSHKSSVSLLAVVVLLLVSCFLNGD
jgi:hypothetical protein